MITRLMFLTRRVGRWNLLLMLLVPSFLSAHPPTADRPTFFDLIYSDDLVEVTLETDLVKLIANIKTEQYQSAVLSFEDKQGQQVVMQTEVRPRGNYRRRVCEFPPLKLKFAKDKLVSANLEPHNKLKLITHCIDNKGVGQENLLKEFLAYKLYNELTDHSYRVQLLRINYVDIKGKLSKIKRYAVLIEDTDEMAERLGGEECNCLNPMPSQMDSRLENIHAAFQYMIGNEDWNLSMNRNLKMVKPTDGRKWIPVPYDFDFSGLVNAPYAVPNTELGLNSIQERKYLGLPLSDPDLKYVFNYFKNKQADLYRVVDDCKYLNKTSRNEVIEYLDTFFAEVDSLLAGNAINLYDQLSGRGQTAVPNSPLSNRGK